MANIIHKTKARGYWVDGIWFGSIAEGERYKVLKRREEDGVIHALKRQPRYPLIHAQTKEKICTYVGDFHYTTADGTFILEDVKGIITEVYKLKKRMMWVFERIHISEVVARPITRNKQIVGYRWKVNGEWEV